MSLLAQIGGLEQATEKGQMSVYCLVILAPHSFHSHIIKIEFNSQINSPVWTSLIANIVQGTGSCGQLFICMK